VARLPHRPTPEPLDVDAVTVVTVLTGVWGVCGLAMLLFARGWLADRGATWWLWTCAAGFGLGLLGIWFVRRRRARLGQHAAARAEDTVPPPPIP
jgi:hypothetical protein